MNKFKEHQVIKSHEEISLMRFISIGEILTGQFLGLARKSNFLENWQLLKSFNPGWIPHFIKTPLFHSWLKTAQYFLSLDLFQNYPNHHPKRHLCDFNRLILNIICYAPNNSAGEVLCLDKKYFHLFFGRGYLIAPVSFEGEKINWSINNGKVEISDDQKKVIAIISQNDQKLDYLNNQWRFVENVIRGGIIFDYSPFELGFSSQSYFKKNNKYSRFRNSWKNLDKASKEFASTILSRIAIKEEMPGWIPGLAIHDLENSLDESSIIKLTFTDLINRALDLVNHNFQFTIENHFVTGIKWRNRTVGVLSEILTSHRLGFEPKREVVKEWNTIYGHIKEAIDRTNFFQLINFPERFCRLQGSLNPFTGNSNREVSQNNLPLAIKKLIPGGKVSFHKTRVGSKDRIDWSSLDSLGKLKKSTLKTIHLTISQIAKMEESHYWLNAMANYLLSEYISCILNLKECLKRDATVEQYWYLMAFAFRHVGNMGAFEKIVFQKDWNIDEINSQIQKTDKDKFVSSKYDFVHTLRRNVKQSKPVVEFKWPWKGIMKDIVEMRGSELQVPQYIAVLAGIRKSLDDWVPAPLLPKFLTTAKRLGLFVKINCSFKSFNSSYDILGAGVVPTTQSFGILLSETSFQDPDTTVHVFVSSKKSCAEAALASGWYSLAINNKMINKPRIDHTRLGLAFGYPECCVNFFSKYNDWTTLNCLAEAAKRSEKFCWETNNLAKHTPFMTTFHLPCSFDCKHTISYSNNLLVELRKHDKDFAENTRYFMRQVYLSISEVVYYLLLGAKYISKDRVRYREALYVGGKNHLDSISDILSKGNELRIENGNIVVLKDGKLKRSILTYCDRGKIEVPVLFNFE